MDHLTCPYCGQACKYNEKSKEIFVLLNSIIAETDQRFALIRINEWRATLELLEENILIGKIVLNDLNDIQKGYTIEDYFQNNEITGNTLISLASLAAYLKWWYNLDEFRDGLHPIHIKFNLTIGS